MSEGKDQDQGKGRLSLRPAGRSDVGRTVDAGSVRQSFSMGVRRLYRLRCAKSVAPVLLVALVVEVPAGGPGVVAP